MNCFEHLANCWMHRHICRYDEKTLFLVSCKPCRVAILYGGHFVDNRERSWTACLCLQLVSSNRRLVGLAYCSRIELSARVLLHKRLYFFFELSSLLRKCCKCMGSQCPSLKAKDSTYFPFRNNTFLCRWHTPSVRNLSVSCLRMWAQRVNCRL